MNKLTDWEEKSGKLAEDLLGGIQYGDSRDRKDWKEKVVKGASYLILKLISEAQEEAIMGRDVVIMGQQKQIESLLLSLSEAKKEAVGEFIERALLGERLDIKLSAIAKKKLMDYIKSLPKEEKDQ